MLSVTSESRASDASYHALVDAAHAAADLASWLIVGGHMVSLHVLRAGVDVPLRVTRDADLGVELLAIRDGRLIERLRSMGYSNGTRGNRFDATRGDLTSSIDLVVPSFETKLVPNMDAGQIAVDGLPVLNTALERSAVTVDLDATLTDGQQVAAAVRIPDVPSAIALKVLAYRQRFAERDAEDVARLLEVAYADGLTTEDWPRSSTLVKARGALSELFDAPGRALGTATDAVAARSRLRALTRSLVGRP
jgi:hypothetical protein